jgi:hypothetical protein
MGLLTITEEYREHDSLRGKVPTDPLERRAWLLKEAEEGLRYIHRKGRNLRVDWVTSRELFPVLRGFLVRSWVETELRKTDETKWGEDEKRKFENLWKGLKRNLDRLASALHSEDEEGAGDPEEPYRPLPKMKECDEMLKRIEAADTLEKKRGIVEELTLGFLFV